jgi:transposase
MNQTKVRASNETDHRFADSQLMRHELVTDEMWAAVEPLLPEEPAKPKGGRPRVPDRDALRGIVFVLRSGIPWEMLPREVFGCSGMTCWRRLRDWQKAGVWDRLHRALLERLHRSGELDWSRAALDSQSTAAKRGAPQRGRTRPTGASRARSGMRSPTRVARRSA